MNSINNCDEFLATAGGPSRQLLPLSEKATSTPIVHQFPIRTKCEYCGYWRLSLRGASSVLCAIRPIYLIVLKDKFPLCRPSKPWKLRQPVVSVLDTGQFTANEVFVESISPSLGCIDG